MKQFDVKIQKPICQAVAASQVAPNGCYQQVNIPVKGMTVEEFRDLSYSSHYKTPNHTDHADLERIYWEKITNHAGIYGADVSGSLTDVDCEDWNINHLGSILDFVNDDYKMSIDGVNTAYLYFGMWKTTFAWHCEDMNLYSINLLHFGMPKTWYSISPKYGKKFEQLANALFVKSQGVCDAFLRHKMTIINPKLLDEYKIPYDKITQEPGQIMITFPYGYHSGFNHGFNCAESTNFATPRWVDYGKHSSICNCTPDAVKFSMDTFVERFQPDKYKSWVEGYDKTPHPENGTITPKQSVVSELRKISFKDRNPDLDINAIIVNPNIPAVVKEELRGSYMVSAEDEIAEYELQFETGVNQLATIKPKKINRSFYDNSSDEEEKTKVKKRKKHDSDYDDDWYTTSGHELISADGKTERSSRGRVSKRRPGIETPSPVSCRKPVIKKEPLLRKSCPEKPVSTLDKKIDVKVITAGKNVITVVAHKPIQQLPIEANVKIVVPNVLKQATVTKKPLSNATSSSFNDAFSQFIAKPLPKNPIINSPKPIQNPLKPVYNPPKPTYNSPKPTYNSPTYDVSVKPFPIPKVAKVKNTPEITALPSLSPLKVSTNIKPTPQQLQQELWTNQIIQSSSKSQPPPLIQRTAHLSTISKIVETDKTKNIIQKVKTEKIGPYVPQELIVTPRPLYSPLDISKESKVSFIITESSTSNASQQLLQQLKTEPEELFTYF